MDKPKKPFGEMEDKKAEREQEKSERLTSEAYTPEVPAHPPTGEEIKQAACVEGFYREGDEVKFTDLLGAPRTGYIYSVKLEQDGPLAPGEEPIENRKILYVDIYYLDSKFEKQMIRKHTQDIELASAQAKVDRKNQIEEDKKLNEERKKRDKEAREKAEKERKEWEEANAPKA